MSQYDRSALAADPVVRERFVAALRATGTLAGAIRATGCAESTVRRQRGRDPDFAAACDAVLNPRRAAADLEPAVELEAVLLRRAIDGSERYRFLASNAVEIWIEYDNKLGMELLAKLMPEKYGPRRPGSVPLPPPITREAFMAVIRAQPRLDPPRDTADG